MIFAVDDTVIIAEISKTIGLLGPVSPNTAFGSRHLGTDGGGTWEAICSNTSNICSVSMGVL